MDDAAKPTRLGQAILATLARLDPPRGRSQNEAVRRARLEPSWLSKVIYGKVSVGYARLRRLAAANEVDEAEFRTWIDAKLEDQREAAAFHERLIAQPLAPVRAPEVAPPGAPAEFHPEERRRGGAPGAPGREATQDAPALSGPAGVHGGGELSEEPPRWFLPYAEAINDLRAEVAALRQAGRRKGRMSGARAAAR